MSKRSGPDIIATILEVANGGIGKTRLLTKANLTSAQFNKYIDILVEKKLLDRSAGAIKSVSYLKA